MPKKKATPDTYCWNCLYYEDDTSRCRRYAPRPILTDRIINETAWPDIRPRDWCGEFKLQDATPRGGWMRYGVSHPADKDLED